ncbi:peptidase S51 [Cryobacterium melibiosiphilum]|uniref:Peptidase S51 n=1 Tax=Cryobacterium melibiosiphilum TaxID=995039 RepID=A0A3A5MPQ5_9MICO|nr:Type 1 glutamine amidotransferase-like domain-containing protein [Cryobacterium melibiosiphilum]RJT87484.1 peptidase S51 [Cryobacterium melibiosiphilum]
MSIHLVGGGSAAEQYASVYGPFLAEAAARAVASGREEPRIAIVTVGSGPGDLHGTELAAALAAAGPVEPRHTALARGDLATLLAVADVDGILIGGGVTPDYLAALLPIAGEIRRQVSAGVPYLGFSAGAMIAAERALVGGWLIGGVEVSPEDSSDGLDEVTVLPGIGLLDVTVEVHAAQRGNLSRLIAATEAGLSEGGLAIDENSALVIGEGALAVVGSGSVWRVSQAEGGVLVSTFGA